MKVINIIAPTVKTGGARELLLYLVEYLELHYSGVTANVYVDKSIEFGSFKKVNFITIYTKFQLFSLHWKSFSNVLYFGNLPPLRKVKNSAVYFHNVYLLLSREELLKLEYSKFSNKLKNFVRQIYIKSFINNVDFVACQNKNIQEQFRMKFDYEDVAVLPFFRICPQIGEKIEKKFDFCYISLAHPHKNHLRLLDALEILSEEGISFNIALTVENDRVEIIDRINKINAIGVVNVYNCEVIPKNDVCLVYSQSKCLIFPSTNESFGLPLVEAVKLGLDVIASNLDFTFEVVEPTDIFDPYSSVDIADKMKKYLERNTKKSYCKVDNKIRVLINRLLKDSFES